jgi:hypothetical protein
VQAHTQQETGQPGQAQREISGHQSARQLAVEHVSRGLPALLLTDCQVLHPRVNDHLDVLVSHQRPHRREIIDLKRIHHGGQPFGGQLHHADFRAIDVFHDELGIERE